MTISTPLIKGPRRRREWDCAGFTLIEVIVSATLSSLLLAAILSAFLMVGRTGYAAGNYSEMESQTRRALDLFGADAREAANIRWWDAQTITLYVATAGSRTIPVTYGYDNVSTSETFRSFYRLPGEPGSVEPRMALVRNVGTEFAFGRFKLEQPGVIDNSATNDLETKQIEVTLRAMRTGATTVMTTQSAISARYILRNKRVSN